MPTSWMQYEENLECLNLHDVIPGMEATIEWRHREATLYIYLGELEVHKETFRHSILLNEFSPPQRESIKTTQLKEAIESVLETWRDNVINFKPESYMTINPRQLVNVE